MGLTARIARLSIVTNILLVAIKASLAFLSGSLAIKADAIHSLSDVASSVIILLGVKISERPAAGFPYGLYKVENLVALASSLLILMAGYEICTEVFVGPHPPLNRIPWAAAGIGLTILITWRFARFELKKGKETGSPSLVADARHIWTDMLSSLVILVSLLGAATGLQLDRYAALIVVVFIVRAAATIFLDSVRVLLDASLDNVSLRRIREIVHQDPHVKKINAVRARNAGRYKFVELDLALQVKQLSKAHKVSEEIGQRVKKEIPLVDRVVIHSQPPEHEQLTVAVPLAADQLSISDHFGEAPFFQLVTFQNHDGAIISERRLRNPHQHEEKAKGIKVANWLLANGLDILLVHRLQSGKGPSLTMENGGAEIQLTEVTNFRTALDSIGESLKKKGQKGN